VNVSIFSGSLNFMRHLTAVLLSAMALYATPQLRLSTSTVGPLNIAVGANGAAQTVMTSNIGDGTLSLSASANVSWITASIVGANVQIALSTSTLPQGIATGIVTVTAPGAIDSPQTIAVTVMMGGGVPASLNFYLPPGGSASTAFVASSQLNANAANPSGGLTLALVAEGGGSFSTTASYQVTATAPAATTPETSYTGHITVTSSAFQPDVKTVPVTVNVTAMPIGVLVQPSIQFNVGQGAAPVIKWIQLGNAGESAVSITGATVSTTASTGAAWLTTSLNGPCLVAGVGACVVATGDPTGLAPGKYTATIAIASNAKNGPFNVPVEMDVLAAAGPTSYYQGVVDNAVYQLGATIAPGELVAVRGEQFTTGAPMSAQSLPLGTSLGGATVYVNGNAAPTYYVAASHVENQGGQITFQVPYSVPAGQATIRVDRNDSGTVQTGNTISVQVASSAPRLLQFALNSSGASITAAAITSTDNIVTENPVGTEYAIATFPDGATFPIPTTAGLASRPATAGDTLVFYGLGFGQTSPPATEGVAISGMTAIANCTMVFETVVLPGAPDITSTPAYCGLTPGSVGLYQVNVTVPVGTPTGVAVPVYLTIGTIVSNSVAIAVQ
jgi:uncharacterized protein (TIGR03437 family)